MEKVSNALLKNGEWTSMRYTNQEAMINERMEQNHSGVKVSLLCRCSVWHVDELCQFQNKNFQTPCRRAMYLNLSSLSW